MTFNEKILYKVDNDKVAEEISEMLMDTEIPTYDMFENLVVAYVNGNDDFRKGMDSALTTLVWKNMEEIVDTVKANCLIKEDN